MKVLITGHMGFVGRQFMRTLDGHDIVGIDIKEGNDAREFFAKDDTRFDLVVHLAAVVGGRATIDGQPLKVATDLAIDSDMFQWALRTRPDRIVYYSSSAAYPIAYQTYSMKYHLHESHINLDSIMNPDQTYGWAKLTGEMLARYAEEEGLRVHVFRPFSGYGGDQDLDYPFPSFIQRAKKKEEVFDIWGSGNQVRDFIHIEDVVNATLEAVKQDIQGPVNLGTGRPTSFNRLAEMVTGAMGFTPEFNRVEDAPEGVAYRVCDPSKMLTFYQPKISLEEGIAKALKG
jgi:nucleoside-diphosphate-sugar epimerase